MNQVGKCIRYLVWGIWLLMLISCSGGGGDNEPSPAGQVQITGVVDDGTETSPLANALCRVVDRRGNERARTTTDANGVYALQVETGVQGYLECSLPTLPDLALSAVISTQKQQSGAQLRDDVSPATTAVTKIVQSRFSAEPQAVKNQLLNDYQAGESKISVLADAATILFNALKTEGIDAKFALAQTDLYADGDLDQPILQPVALEVKQQVDAIETQIRVPDAFAQLATADGNDDNTQAPEDGEGEDGGDTDDSDGGVEGDADDGAPTSPIDFAACRYTTLADPATGAVDGAVIASVIADEEGLFFFPVDPVRKGILECNPPELPGLELMTFVRKGVVGERIPDVSVTPWTTGVITRAVMEFRAADPTADLQQVKERLNRDMMINKQPSLMLLRMTSIALYNLLFKPEIDTDFKIALDDLFEDGELNTPGLESVAQQINPTVIELEQRFGLAVEVASTTGNIEGVVTAADGTPLVGAQVEAEGTDKTDITAADGTFRLNQVPRGATTITASLEGFEPQSITLIVVAIATRTLTDDLVLSLLQP